MTNIDTLEAKAQSKANMLAAIFGAKATNARVIASGSGNGGIAFTLTKGEKSLNVSITSGPDGSECSVTDEKRGGEIHWSHSPAELNKFLIREFS